MKFIKNYREIIRNPVFNMEPKHIQAGETRFNLTDNPEIIDIVHQAKILTTVVTVGSDFASTAYGSTTSWSGYSAVALGGVLNQPFGSLTNTTCFATNTAYRQLTSISSTGSFQIYMAAVGIHTNTGFTRLYIGTEVYERVNATFATNAGGNYTSWTWTPPGWPLVLNPFDGQTSVNIYYE